MPASSGLAPVLQRPRLLITTTTARFLILTTILAMISCATNGHHGTTPEELEAYKSRHYSALPGEILGTASSSDLLNRFRDGGLLLMGDIHDDRALHLLQTEVIQQLVLAHPKVVLHVEFLGSEDEAILREYLHGTLDLPELRLAVQERWPGSWMEFQGFDSLFYRRLLAVAKEQALKVRSLEPIPRLPLRRRDPFMAEEISKAVQEFPDHLHIVLIGHTHLLGEGHLISHLPRANRLILLPRGGYALTHRLGAYASLHSAAWHAPYLILDEELWLLNPLPLRSFGTD